jgi:sulfite oxidase
MNKRPHSDSGLIVHSGEPLNVEPHLARLGAAFLTPQRDFYIRSHGKIPQLDAATHQISVRGRVGHSQSFTFAGLQSRFAHRKVTAAMQCAGNRRADMHAVAAVAGVPWAPGAIGNATWTGVSLAGVLRECGAELRPGLHVAFACADTCELDGKRFNYGASIPIGKAMTEDVLLAWALNGEALAPEHGYPLRVVVPGYAGVRSPKWLTAIAVQDSPSDSPIQTDDYKLFPPDCTKQTADPARGLTINDMPVNSAICTPPAHATLPSGLIVIRGYAIATVRRIVRVDVSADEGRSWRQAELQTDASSPWAWTLWQTEIDLPPGNHVLAVRAWDEAGQTQPSRPDETWNYKGYLCTAWHRVPVSVA